MTETQKPTNTLWASEKTKTIISQKLKYKKGKRLEWHGYKPDGTKNNFWNNHKDVDLEKHFSGIVNQGGNLAYEEDGKLWAVNGVVDVDKLNGKSAKQFCQDLFKLNPKAIPVRSPSGVNFHAWFFFPKPLPVAEAAAHVKKLGFQLERKGYTIDFGKCNPTPTGSDIGINFPFNNHTQVPYDPRGEKYTDTQFIERLRFNNFPYIAACINLPSGKNRHDALLYSLSQLWEAGKFKEEYIEKIKSCFHTTDIDGDWFDRIIIKEQKYKKYTLGDKTIENKIGEITGIEDFKFHKEEPPTKEIEEEEITPLEVKEYSGAAVAKKRDWAIHGICQKKAFTTISAPAGAGKTTAGALLAYSFVTGKSFLNHHVYTQGNVLMIVNEETENEVILKMKAIEKEYGIMPDQFKVCYRTIEDPTKLAIFDRDGKATPTPEYKSLEKLCEKIKFTAIYIDPLISLKTGNFNENSNDNMETLAKDFIIKLAVKFDLAIIGAHHNNKLSQNIFQEEADGYTVDNLALQYSARGASSLLAAARSGFVMMGMPKRLWDDTYAELAGGKYERNNLVGFFDAKANYTSMSDKPLWLDKRIKEIPVEGGHTETVMTLVVSDINDLVDARHMTHLAANQEKLINLFPAIKSFFKLTGEAIERMENKAGAEVTATLNSLVEYLVRLDPEFQNKSVKEQTIKSRIKRLIEAAAPDNHPVEMPNTKLKFSYFYDRYGGKSKHMVKITGKELSLNF